MTDRPYKQCQVGRLLTLVLLALAPASNNLAADFSCQRDFHRLKQLFWTFISRQAFIADCILNILTVLSFNIFHVALVFSITYN